MLLPLERVRRLFSLDIRHVCGLPAMFFGPETLFPRPVPGTLPRLREWIGCVLHNWRGFSSHHFVVVNWGRYFAVRSLRPVGDQWLSVGSRVVLGRFEGRKA